MEGAQLEGGGRDWGTAGVREAERVLFCRGDLFRGGANRYVYIARTKHHTLYSGTPLLGHS